MTHMIRRQKQKFPCTHVGLGKYCHRCKDEKAGRIKPKAAVTIDSTGAEVSVDAPKKTWKRAKCPFCGGSRVKKNDINAFSDLNAKEYRCTSFECGKEFNSEQVKEYDEVEVRERLGPQEHYRRLTD